jgi:SAM-dependent methyltransferase
MDRINLCRGSIKKTDYGIEIAPWFNPIVPKCEGFRSLSLDVFDTETLIKNAKVDTNIPKESISKIEKVDLVGNASNIENIISNRNELGLFDYIVSSHNFEHLPNPIKFLQGCASVLKKNGLLSLAVPDKRSCFDYFRPNTSLGEWIESFFNNQEQPTFRQLFNQNSMSARLNILNNITYAFSINDNPNHIILLPTLQESFVAWKTRLKNNDKTYYDCHCSVFSPHSLEMLLNDLQFLGLSPFKIEDLSESYGCEFFIKLRNIGYKSFNQDEINIFNKNREISAVNVQNEISFNTVYSSNLKTSNQNYENRLIDNELKKINNKIDSLRNFIELLNRSKAIRLLSLFRGIKNLIKKVFQF